MDFCVCVGDADTILLLRIFYPFFLLIPVFLRNLRSLLFRGGLFYENALIDDKNAFE